jgi:predicted nuclease of predicted toxin-antitoxin system
VRFLADAGISPKTVGFLLETGHEAVHVSTIGMQSAEDRALIARALADAAVILTFDLDFGDILALGVLDRPSVVIFRLSDERADSVNRRLAAVLAERFADLDAGALILVEDSRYRIRRLPISR